MLRLFAQKIIDIWNVIIDKDKYEAPALDACNGHLGVTPESGGELVYHYHVSALMPLTVGCFGPDVDGEGHPRHVSPQLCRTLYAECGDGDTVTVTTAQGTYECKHCPVTWLQR